MLETARLSWNVLDECIIFSFHENERKITLDEIEWEPAQETVMTPREEIERCYLSCKDILDNFWEVGYLQPTCSIDYAGLDI